MRGVLAQALLSDLTFNELRSTDVHNSTHACLARRASPRALPRRAAPPCRVFPAGHGSSTERASLSQPTRRPPRASVAQPHTPPLPPPAMPPPRPGHAHHDGPGPGRVRVHRMPHGPEARLRHHPLRRVRPTPGAPAREAAACSFRSGARRRRPFRRRAFCHPARRARRPRGFCALRVDAARRAVWCFAAGLAGVEGSSVLPGGPAACAAPCSRPHLDRDLHAEYCQAGLRRLGRGYQVRPGVRCAFCRAALPPVLPHGPRGTC